MPYVHCVGVCCTYCASLPNEGTSSVQTQLPVRATHVTVAVIHQLGITYDVVTPSRV